MYYIFIYTHTRTYRQTDTCTYTHGIYRYTQTYTNIYIYQHTHIYIYIYIYYQDCTVSATLGRVIGTDPGKNHIARPASRSRYVIGPLFHDIFTLVTRLFKTAFFDPLCLKL